MTAEDGLLLRRRQPDAWILLGDGESSAWTEGNGIIALRIPWLPWEACPFALLAPNASSSSLRRAACGQSVDGKRTESRACWVGAASLSLPEHMHRLALRRIVCGVRVAGVWSSGKALKSQRRADQEPFRSENIKKREKVFFVAPKKTKKKHVCAKTNKIGERK